MNYIHHYLSPLGGITLASDGEALTGVWVDGQKQFPNNFAAESTEAELPVFAQTFKWLDAYFSGKVPDFTPTLTLQTTLFRRAVCRAVGHNPISIIIPCHRVIGADGSLTGYTGGTDRKRALLKTEQGDRYCTG